MEARTLEVVGRDDELARVGSFLGQTDALPGALLLEGEAGIGKTTLWLHAVRLAQDQGCHVLRCSASASEAQLSFAALGDLLDDVFEDVLSELPQPRRRALEVALLLEESRGAPPEQRAVALAFLSALRILAGKDRVVVAVDDVQWLDSPTAGVLEFAFRRLGHDRIAFLLTQRVEGSSGLPLGLSRAPSVQVEAIHVGPLSLGALHHVLRLNAGIPLTRPVLRRVHAASGGNPFFALEIARALERRGGEPDPGRPLPVPGTLQELVRERLDALPAHARAALATTAALAQPSVLRVGLENLDAAVEAGVVELDGERIHFTHPLLASAAYAAVGEAERRRIHQWLAKLVDDPGERARHLALGARGPDTTVSAALDEGAQQASSRGASDTACELAELAVRLTPPTRQDDLRKRRLALAGFQIRAGELSRARSMLEAMVEEVPPGPDRAVVLFRLASTRADDMGALIELAEHALAEAGDDYLLASSIHQNLSSYHLWLDGVERARRDARAAVDFAERAGDSARLAGSLATLGYQDDLAGEPRRGDFWERALAFEDEASAPIYWGPRLAYGVHLMFKGRLDEARSFLQAAHDRATAHGHEWAIGEADHWLAEVELRAGNWQIALHRAEASLQLVEDMEVEQDQGGALARLAMVEAHLGHSERARTHAEAGRAFSEAAGDEQCRVFNLAALGFLELSVGDPAAADGLLRPLWPLLVSRGYGEPSFIPVLPNAIEALIALGELSAARELLAQLEERGRLLDHPWAHSHAARCRGLLTAADGDLEGALPHIERALAEHARDSEPFEQGRTLLALGQILRRTKRKRAARESILEALDVFERLGAGLWVEKAKAELARIGGRAKSEGGLTESERRIAELVAEGQSNKEVAAALFVSPKTVDVTLSRVYAKLGVHSRTELARRLTAGKV